MKKLYSLLLTAIAMIGVSFSTQAQDRQVTVEWDTPGSILLKTGNNSGPYLELGDATSYVYYYEGYEYFYVYPADGYYLIKVVDENTGTEYKPTYYPYCSVGVGQGENGRKYHVYVGKYNFDASITVDFQGICRNDMVTANIGTRKISLGNGKQTIQYESSNDKTVQFVASNDYLHPISDLSITMDGVSIDWPNNYGTYKTQAINLENGAKFVIHYNDEQPVEAAKYTVTLEYDSDDAKAAIEMISNRSTMTTINERESFQVEDGNEISISFNTKNYNVKIDDVALTPDAGDYTLWKSGAIKANRTIKISATEREWGTTYLSIGIEDPEGVVLHAEAYNGKVVDLSTLTPSTETIYGTTFTVYQVPVSLKSPKVFVTEADGWYVPQAGYGNPSSTTGASAFDETYCAREGETTPLHVWTHKIVKDTRLVVVVKGTLSAARLKDQHNNADNFPLVEGYNEFMIDPVYSKEFSVAPIKSSEDDPYSVYLNYSACNIDENGVYSGIAVNKPSVIHIFSLVPASMQHTYTIENKALTAPEITYDRVLSPDENANSFNVFVGSEVSIKPAAGYSLFIDDEKMDLDENGAYKFTQGTGAFTDHDILISQPDLIVTDPADGSTVEDFEYATISFPNAKTVTFNQDEAADEITLQRGEGWANYGWTIETVEGSSFPKFRFTPRMNVPAGNLSLTIHEGFFTIDGEYTNSLTYVNFTNEKTLPDWQASPEKYVINEAWGPQVAFSYGEDASIKVIDASGFSVKYQGNVLTKNDYMYMVEGGFLMFGLDPKYGNTEGELTISIPAGALQVNGKTAPAMEYTWNVVLPKEYTLNVTPQFALDALTPDQKLKFTIEFPEAQTAELYNEYSFSLRESKYTYTENGTVAAVADAEYPTYELTFPAIGKEMSEAAFTLSIRFDAFILDGVQGSPDFEQTYTLTVTKKNVMEYTLTPAAGATVESIEAITIEFPNATTVEFQGEDGMTSEISMHNSASSYYTEYFTVEKVAGAAVPTFTLTPDQIAKANGEYTLAIGAGQFLINGKENEEMSATYTVYKQITAEDLTYTIDPEAGSNIDNEYAADITVAFAEGLEIDAESADLEKFSIKLGDTELVAFDDYTPEIWQNNLMFNINVQNKTGKLTLTLAEGWAKIAGIDAPAISAEWNVIGKPTAPVVLTPLFDLDGGLTPNDQPKLLLAFPQAKKAEVWAPGYISFKYGFYDYTGTIQSIEQVADAPYPTFEIVYQKVGKEIKNGKFTFALMKSAFLLDGKQSPEFEEILYITISNTSGISSIFGDDVDTFTVVTIDGRVILRDADAAALEQLADGLYIINGQKVYLKK